MYYSAQFKSDVNIKTAISRLINSLVKQGVFECYLRYGTYLNCPGYEW